MINHSAGLIAIMIGRISPNAPIDDEDTLVQAESIRAVLRQCGYDTTTIHFALDLQCVQNWISALAPKFVVNLVESIDGSSRLIHLAPALLDCMALPYTGCGAAATMLSSDKIYAKRQLRAAGLRTPDWVSGSMLPDREPFSGPWIIKSVHEHASIGLDGSSVTNNWAEIPYLISKRHQCYGGAWFVEKFVEGKEFHLSLLGSSRKVFLLPFAEMLFVDYPENKPRIVDYAAKWIKKSFEYKHTIRFFVDPQADSHLVRTLNALGESCWWLFDLNGYAEIDVRVDSAGVCWIIDVNSNPCIAPDSGFVAAAMEQGLSYSDLILQVTQLLNNSGNTGMPPIIAHSTRRSSREELSLNQETLLRNLTWRDNPYPSDLQEVEEILGSTDFFDEEEESIAKQLVKERLFGAGSSDYLFIFVESCERLLGFACFGPALGTQSSWELFWIVVHADLHRIGLGTNILSRVEAAVVVRCGERIYVETSSRHQYQSTRAFYEKLGYQETAKLCGFYSNNDDKVVYMKLLDNFPE
jgi:D-alanine-D-alanine ligase